MIFTDISIVRTAILFEDNLGQENQKLLVYGSQKRLWRIDRHTWIDA